MMAVIVEGEHVQSCGYCKHKTTHENQIQNRIMFGVHAFHVRPENYQHWLMCNWRRCGTYYYIPYNWKHPDRPHQPACCPLYAIRLPVLKHQPTSGQFKVLKKLKTFLSPSVTNKKPVEKELNTKEIRIKEQLSLLMNQSLKEQLKQWKWQRTESKKIKSEILKRLDLNAKPQAFTVFSCFYQSNDFLLENVLYFKDGNYLNFICIETEDDFILCKSKKHFEELLIQTATSSTATLNRIKIEKQEIIKETKEKKLMLRLRPAKEFHNDEYEMYDQYQKSVHHEQSTSPEGYQRFLCHSSLETTAAASSELLIEVSNLPDVAFNIEKQNSKLPLLGYGSFHLRYEVWQDDQIELLAMSVIDVLPAGISSVYFVYDEKYSNLSLGVLSGLIEIQLLKYYQQTFPDFQYYFLGYYIQNCQKMKYKAQFKPSEILCPITHLWAPVDDPDVQKCLTEYGYCQLVPPQMTTQSQLQAHLKSADFDRLEFYLPSLKAKATWSQLKWILTQLKIDIEDLRQQFYNFAILIRYQQLPRPLLVYLSQME